MEDEVPEKPLEAKVMFMPNQMAPEETQTKFGITYICNEGSDDSYETFKLEILSELLFQGPNSPFYKKIIQTGIAPSFAPGTGYNSSFKQGTFTVGVQGIKQDDVPKVEEVIQEVLQEAYKTGFEEKLFETVLHKIELQTKMTKTNTGIMYFQAMVPYCLHGGDPLDVFKINELSERIRADFKQGNLFESLIEKYFLNNNHMLKLQHIPDKTEAEK